MILRYLFLPCRDIPIPNEKQATVSLRRIRPNFLSISSSCDSQRTDQIGEQSPRCNAILVEAFVPVAVIGRNQDALTAFPISVCGEFFTAAV